MDYPITPWFVFFNSGACEFSGGKGDVFFDVVYPDWCDWFDKKKWGTIDKQFVPGGSKFGWVLLPLKQLLGRAPINQDTPFIFFWGGWYATLLRAHHYSCANAALFSINEKKWLPSCLLDCDMIQWSCHPIPSLWAWPSACVWKNPMHARKHRCHLPLCSLAWWYLHLLSTKLDEPSLVEQLWHV